MKTATVSMESLSFDTLDRALSQQREREQAQTDIRVCDEHLAARGASPLRGSAQNLRTCFVEIDFDALPSPEREWFLGLPTTFAVPEDSVKKLIEVAGRLLRDSADFQKLLRALRGEPTVGAGVGEAGNCSSPASIEPQRLPRAHEGRDRLGRALPRSVGPRHSASRSRKAWPRDCTRP